MIFRDLLSKYKWEEIYPALVALYPDEEKNEIGYQLALAELSRIEPTSSDLVIRVLHVDDEPNGYEDVSAWREGERPGYALDFVTWAEVLAMRIGEDVFKRYSELDILCHILWEVTWHGYSAAEVDVKNIELQDAVREMGL